LNKKKVRSIARNIITGYENMYNYNTDDGKGHKKVSVVGFEWQHRLRSLIKSIVVLNALFRSSKALPGQYRAVQEDYDTFERLFKRICDDHYHMMSSDKKVGQHTLGSSGGSSKSSGKGKVVN